MPVVASQIGMESTGEIPFLQIKGIGEKYMGHLFITSSISHFFNKTDFEQYLFNEKKFVFFQHTAYDFYHGHIIYLFRLG